MCRERSEWWAVAYEHPGHPQILSLTPEWNPFKWPANGKISDFSKTADESRIREMNQRKEAIYFLTCVWLWSRSNIWEPYRKTKLQFFDGVSPVFSAHRTIVYRFCASAVDASEVWHEAEKKAYAVTAAMHGLDRDNTKWNIHTMDSLYCLRVVAKSRRVEQNDHRTDGSLHVKYGGLKDSWEHES